MMETVLVEELDQLVAYLSTSKGMKPGGGGGLCGS